MRAAVASDCRDPVGQTLGVEDSCWLGGEPAREQVGIGTDIISE